MAKNVGRTEKKKKIKRKPATFSYISVSFFSFFQSIENFKALAVFVSYSWRYRNQTKPNIPTQSIYTNTCAETKEKKKEMKAQLFLTVNNELLFPLLSKCLWSFFTRRSYLISIILSLQVAAKGQQFQ